MASSQGIIPETHISHFNAFEKLYPTPERRFEAAQSLADPDCPLPPESDNPGRNFLIAQWGDSSPELLGAASFLYSLKKGVETHTFQPMMVFRRGTHADIFSDDEDTLEDDVVIDYGLITSNFLLHGFAGNLKSHGAKRMGVEPPFLGFGVQAIVIKRARIEVDVIGDCTVTTLDEGASAVPICIGTVPLSFDLEQYQETRRVQQRQTVFGTKLCAPIVERLKGKIRGTKAREALSKLALSA